MILALIFRFQLITLQLKPSHSKRQKKQENYNILICNKMYPTSARVHELLIEDRNSKMTAPLSFEGISDLSKANNNEQTSAN